MENGEMARYERFLRFRSVFKSVVQYTRKNQDLFGKRLILYQIVSSLNNSDTPYENIMGKVECY